jgi:ectoine hydroxylase-related dioxygenase (phytanoyl-CoA dioxygenase family)
MVTNLTTEQIESYRRKGYLMLPGVFSQEEAAAWGAECKRLLRLGLAHKDNIRTTAYYLSKTMYVVDRFDPVLDISPVFKKLAHDERIFEAVRAVFGEDMLLFKDRLIYKMIGMRGYPIHQDYSWWQAFPSDLVNVIISIDKADAENGGVEFFPGYHHRLLSTPGEMRHMNEVEAQQIDFRTAELLETEPGDMILFSCLTPHRSGPNLSNRTRRQIYFTYSAARHGDLYDTQLRLFKEGLSSRQVRSEEPERLFFR